MLSARSAGPAAAGRAPARAAGEVFLAFLRLGITSFGGPIAHLGYFRAEFVARRAWLDEAAYADIVALCQFLPGPASSQVGFALGLMRAGWRGGLAAFAGFTLPSAGLLVAFAAGAPSLAQTPAGAGVLHGLKLVAVAVVAQAVWGMARTLCPDRPRAAIGTVAAVLALLAPGAVTQVAAIAFGAAAGLWAGTEAATGRPPDHAPVPVGRTAGIGALVAFAVLLSLTPLLRAAGGASAVFAAFYRSGALVFGGGHVVLPLLRDALVPQGWVSDSTFMAGYGAAQAVPGPLFTLAAFLGEASLGPAGGLEGAAIALVAIFLPGLLLVTGALPFWGALRSRHATRAALGGANAAVVGLLGAALYHPVWTGAVAVPADVATAVVGFVCLTAGRVPPLAVVTLGALLGLVRGLAS